jgi:hypothetical protein
MDEDQDFETFLREWAKERIWSTHDFLLQHYMAKQRAIELIQLATANGFGDKLERATYDSVAFAACQTCDELPPSHQRSPLLDRQPIPVEAACLAQWRRFLDVFLQRDRRLLAHHFIRRSAASYLLLEP